MESTLRTFMHGLVDYAGLFPPARLNMADAVQKYSEHLGTEFRWMLGRFICPASRLSDFASHSDLLTAFRPVNVSVLAGIFDPSSCLNAAASDSDHVVSFEQLGWGRADVLEVKWPFIGRDDTPANVRRAIDAYVAIFDRSGAAFDRLFFEIPRTDNWAADVSILARALHDSDGRFGFKLRCGGVTSDLYPSPEEVAVAIAACVKHAIPFKATAGLHHPVRHDRPDEGVIQHGFFNVFGAFALLKAGAISRDELVELIDERDASNFSFGSDSFSWRHHTVPHNIVSDARSRLAISYGSCSFEEPVEDLAAANLL